MLVDIQWRGPAHTAYRLSLIGMHDRSEPTPARVDYRVGPFIRWSATVSSPAGEFDDRVVRGEDAEGIYLAALTALDALRRESGRLIEAEHVLHEDLVPAQVRRGKLTHRQPTLRTRAHIRRSYPRVPAADVRFRK